MHEERLDKLASHLETGTLGHEIWDFAHYNLGAKAPGLCGTAGCAIGELPILWPKDFQFGVWADVTTSSSGRFQRNYDAAAAWFDISYGESQILFVPCANWNVGETETIDEETFVHLPADSTRYQVAANIRRFIAAKKREQVKLDGRKNDLPIPPVPVE